MMTVKVMDFEGNLYSDDGFRVDIPGNTSLVYYDTLQSALLGRLNPKEVLLLVTLKGDFPAIVAKNILYLVPPVVSILLQYLLQDTWSAFITYHLTLPHYLLGVIYPFLLVMIVYWSSGVLFLLLSLSGPSAKFGRTGLIEKGSFIKSNFINRIR